MIYATVIGALLKQFGIFVDGPEPNITVMTIVTSIFAIMGEEPMKKIEKICDENIENSNH